MIPLFPILPLLAFLGGAPCQGAGCSASPPIPNLSGLVVPVLVAWVILGAHDVFRMSRARLGPVEHRLFGIATGLRLLAGFFVAVGALAGMDSSIAPAMLVAAATLVLGSSWFEERARSAAAGPELS